MFTSISALRASTAQTQRVNTVASNLRKLNSEWKDDWYFPIIAIGLSNATDDVSWVKNNQSVLLQSGPKQLRSVRGNTTITATELNGAARKHYPNDLYSTSKTVKVNESLTELNKYLQVALVNADFDWVHGLTTEGITESTAPKVDEVTGTTTAETAAAASATTGPSDDAEVETKARAAFAKVFPDVDLATVTNSKGTKFANDRTHGKFVGFLAALKALEGGAISFGDVFPRH